MGFSYGGYQDTDEVESLLDETEDATGLDADVFDDVTVDTSLPDNVPAATRVYTSGLGYPVHTEFVANDTFFELPEDQQVVTAAHEILEGAQARYDLGDVMQEEFDASDELAELVSDYQRREDRLREGMTQALTNALVPGDQRSGKVFYPYETDIFEAILEENDIDLADDLDVDEGLLAEYTLDEPVTSDAYEAEPTIYAGPGLYDDGVDVLTYDGLDGYDMPEDLVLYDGLSGRYDGPAC